MATDWTAVAAMPEGQAVTVDGKHYTVETVVSASNYYLRGKRGGIVNLCFMDHGPRFVTGWRLTEFDRGRLPRSTRDRCKVEMA